MKIIMQSLEYNFDNEGNTVCVNGLFNGSQDREYLNTRVCIKKEDIPEDQDIDDMSCKQLEKLCRQRLADITAVKEE